MASQPIDPQIIARVQAGEPIVIVDPLPDGDLLRRFASQAQAPFVIDKGKSYSPLKETLGSNAVELDMRNPIFIPPMPQGNQS